MRRLTGAPSRTAVSTARRNWASRYDALNRLRAKTVPASASGALGYSVYSGYEVRGLVMPWPLSEPKRWMPQRRSRRSL
jgi:hypothetical protein